jgi:hypothetical protein
MNKKEPKNWAAWRDQNYPQIKCVSYWDVSPEIQKEFDSSPDEQKYGESYRFVTRLAESRNPTNPYSP